MEFLRTEGRRVRESAWVLCVKPSTLAEWNGGFDRQMKPLRMPDRRGTAGKVSADTVRQVVAAARQWQASGQRIGIDRFTEHVAQVHGIDLSRKTVSDILVANDLYQVHLKKRRPRFHQSLRQAIPNGLVGVDGSEFTLWVDHQPHTFNLELCVDIPSFHHNSFHVSDTETSEAVLTVLEERRVKWGASLGVVMDHDSANLGAPTQRYLERYGIEPVTVGPGNPKGNGTLEGAFSQMKEAIGTIELDTSCPRGLARSVLEQMAGLYLRMRNRLPVGQATQPPEAQMHEPTAAAERQEAKERYRRHNERKRNRRDPSQEHKRERLAWIIRYHELDVDEPSRKRAETCIVHYEMAAITASEEAFLRAIRRDGQRATLAYFFGILNRIQQQRDTDRHHEYCRQRYEYHRVLEREREQHRERNETPTVDTVVAQLFAAVTSPMKPLQDIAMKQGRRMLESLKARYRYLGVLKKQIAEVLGDVHELTLAQRTEIFAVVEETLA